MFATDVPPSCADPDRPAAQTYRIIGSRPREDALRGSLYDSGFVLEYAARAQAPLQLCVSARLLPSASQRHKAMLTEELSTAVALFQRRTIQGSVVSPSYKVQESFAKCTVIDNASGSPAYKVISNDKDHKAPGLRHRSADAAPGVGESHVAFPSDCFGWSCREGAFDARDPAYCDDLERTCTELVAEWKQLKCEWSTGNKSRAAPGVPGCVVRVAIGGARGHRFLGVAPEPAPWPARADMVCDHQSVRGLPLEFANANRDAKEL